MERTYNYISLFFVAILSVLLWGFYKTYIIFFPSFEGFTYVHHFHGILMLTWLFMLIAQPLLIRAEKCTVHRALGKLSYIVVPLLLLSIFMVAKTSYHKAIPVLPKEQAVAGMALSIPSLFAFAAIYLLAIVNKENTPYHMRYMIGTSLLMIGPGLGRALIVYFNVPFPAAVNYTDYTVIAIAALLMLYDIRKKKTYQPFAVTLMILLVVHAAWHFQLSSIWQAIGGTFADLLF